MLAGGFTFGGKTTEIKDCLQNDGVAAAQFKETCVGLAEFPVSLGEKAAKITYMSACSKPSQGVCEKLFGQAISGHYYKRDAAALADAKQACIAQGGKWK